MKMYRLGIGVLIVLSLPGCGLIPDHSSDYLKAEPMPPTVVPEGLDSSALGETYPIPVIADDAITAKEFVTPRPQSVAVNVFEEVVKIQSLGDKRWILTNRSPSETWPRIRNILNNNGIAVAKADATAGNIDTAWLQFKDDDSNKHRFRFSLEPGIPLNSTEIHVLHEQVPIAAEASEGWPNSSSNDEREKTMLESVASLLAGDITSGAVSLMAQAIGGKPRVDILTPKVADPFLLIKTDYARAWASVSYSLERDGFTIIDRDQSEGVFYVNYRSEEEAKPGFFRRLLADKEDQVLRVNYLVLVGQGEQGTEVRVVGPDRTSVPADTAVQLLKVVRNNLS